MKKVYLLMALMTMCLSVFAQDDVYVDSASGLSYKITESKVNSSDYVAAIVANAETNPYSEFTEVVIPAAVIRQIGKTPVAIRVVGITQAAFKGNKTIKKVTCAKNAILMIGTGAFRDCEALEEVDLSIQFGESLSDAQKENLMSGFLAEMKIGTKYNTLLCPNAFKDCNKLTTVKLPSYITEIGASAFSGCSSLTNPNMDDLPNLTKYNNLCFENCTSLENFYVGEKVKTLGEHMFQGCSKLSYVEWEAKNMADFAEGTSPFYDLRNNEVELEVENVSEMTRVPAYMFYGMKNLSYTWIMDEIGAHAFDGCTHLQLPRYMNYITKIEEGAYNGLQSNSMIYLPSTPIDIYDENVFGEAGQNSTFIVMEGDCDANLAYKSAPHWSGFNILSKGDWKQPSQEMMILDEHPTGAGSSVSSSLGDITKIATCDDPTFTIVVRDDAEAKCKDAGGNVTIIPFGYIMYNGEKIYKRTATFEQKDNEEKVYIVYTADVPDAVENVAGKNTQYRKVVRNGMILIERDGKIYNLLGAEM